MSQASFFLKREREKNTSQIGSLWMHYPNQSNASLNHSRKGSFGSEGKNRLLISDIALAAERKQFEAIFASDIGWGNQERYFPGYS